MDARTTAPAPNKGARATARAAEGTRTLDPELGKLDAGGRAREALLGPLVRRPRLPPNPSCPGCRLLRFACSEHRPSHEQEAAR